MSYRIFGTALVLGVGVLLAAASAVRGGDPIDFNRDIRPILSDRCLKCHGFDEPNRKGGLRLDTREGITAPAESGVAPVISGDPSASALMDRVSHADPDLRMPPADAGPPLTAAQIEKLRAWIAQGAAWSPHWALAKPQRPPLPRVRDKEWGSHPVDRFLLARMESAGVQPSLPADRRTVVRRLHLDLLGLPPSPAEVASAVDDVQPDWYERLVDRLLENPHYGERIGRIWLDAARYADSSGYANDKVRSIWPYRDWVVNAINADMPFDQFTIEQLAGDLLEQPTIDQVVATGFHRNTPHQYEGGSDPEQYRVDRVKNRVDTTGTVWLGLTIGCAQCHTHKYDPISHTEYYQLYAFFNSDDEPESWAVDVEKKTTSLVMQPLSTPRATHRHLRGSFLSPGEPVAAITPAALHPFQAQRPNAANRLDLARWLVAADNPLTARVIVNRMWLHLFGAGLVQTENDFGSQGALPSHPELLDWLAVRFMTDGWSMKSLQRLLVTSAAYRQSSVRREDLDSVDPTNQLVARQSRHRVEAEVVRDLALGASGLLAGTMGGPAVFPTVAPHVMGTSSAKHDWPISQGADRFRRAIYTALYRAEMYPLLSTFDGPDRDNACTRRNRSNTPLQSLTLANDPAMLEIAQGLGKRLLSEHAPDARQRILQAFNLCLGREPNSAERDSLVRYYQQQLAHYATDEKAAGELMGPMFGTVVPQSALAEAAACVALGRVMLNLDEFVTRE